MANRHVYTEEELLNLDDTQVASGATSSLKRLADFLANRQNDPLEWSGRHVGLDR